jgi:hypothetical protein
VAPATASILASENCRQRFLNFPALVLGSVIGMQDGGLPVRAAPENGHAGRVNNQLRFLAAID